MNNVEGNIRSTEGNPNQVELNFVVNGKKVVVEKVNIHQPLHVAAQKALDESGNTARPLSDWLVKYNEQDLNLNTKVEDFHFHADSIIFMSLKSATGGTIC